MKVRQDSALNFLLVVLKIGWWGAIAALGLLAAAVVVLGFISPEALEGKLSGISLYANGLQLIFETPLEGNVHKSWLMLMFGAFGVPMIGITLVIIHQLNRIIATVKKGTPFIWGNVRRIRRIGVAILGLAVVHSLAGFVTSYYLMTHVQIPGVTINAGLNLNVALIVIGLVVVMALAEVFRVGAKLQEDQDLTI